MLLLTALLACRPASPDTGLDELQHTGTDATATSTSDTAADTDLDTGEPFGVLLDTVTYHLTWDMDGVEVLPDGGWRVTNDLGDTIEVTDGFLVTYVLHLEPCREARHSGDDPSAFAAPWIERLDVLTDQAIDTTTFDPNNYCGAYYGVARSDWSARNPPADLNTDGVSLWLSGRWWSEGGEPQDFEWSTNLSNGWADDLQFDAALEQEGVVEVKRSPAALFNGLDLNDDPDVLLRDVLKNLVFSVSFTLL